MNEKPIEIKLPNGVIINVPMTSSVNRVINECLSTPEDLRDLELNLNDMEAHEKQIDKAWKGTNTNTGEPIAQETKREAGHPYVTINGEEPIQVKSIFQSRRFLAVGAFCAFAAGLISYFLVFA